ncbi:protein tyrosine kinase domain-containing protein [Ditylenchus destructor]|uniref:Protein tyrosine kinase domain-containing protein n=1 Tax=Ditylenchus destructor TaxID=166010 RepID=A0AAD4NF43_9BILA|nr:protein tyrosine kinase domain-containing protein [Ditylenchus destructor]
MANIINSVQKSKFGKLEIEYMNKTISVALLFPETPFNLPWIHDSATLEEQLNIEHLASILHVPGVIDNNSMSTLDMFNKAVDKYRKLYPDFERQPVQEPVPRLILVTDFVSLKFIDNFLARHAKHTLAKFELKIHVLNNNTTLHYYIDHNLISARDIDLRDSSNPSLIIPVDPDDENYAQSNDQSGLASNSSRLYYPGPSKEKLVFFTVLISFSAFILLLVAGTFIYRRKLLWIHKLEHFRAHHRKNPVQCEEQIMADYWELSWDKLLVKSEKLGSGAYGQVFRGSIIGKPPCFDYVYHNRPNCVIDMENCEVAVKMLPRYASDAARDEFLYEIDMMKSMGYNENIVNMLGCITIGRTLCLVLEFCPNKDLLHYVKIVKEEMDESDEIEDKLAYIKDFLLFAWQISDGMRFLNSKGIIHRDLAARNILIDAERNAKICDFGLCITTNYKSLPLNDSSSRSKQPHKVSTSGRLPIKWLAIECLQNQEFSYKSDVWSFAILLYETYSFGAPPFHDIEPQLLLSHLEMGNRPAKPEYCPGEIYDIMQKCWSKAPDDRPTFHELLTLFTILLERATEGYGYLSLLKSNAGPCGKINKLIMAKSFRHESSPERRRSRAALDLTRRAQSNANLKSLENSKRGGNAAMKRQRSSLFGFY